MHLLNAAAILAAKDRRTETIECPEWGGAVLIGEMGPLDNARLVDWWFALREQRIAERNGRRATDEESQEPLTCDDTPPRDDGGTERSPGERLAMLRAAVMPLLEAARTLEAERIGTAIERVEAALRGDDDEDLSMMRVADHVEWRIRYVAASILDPESAGIAFTLEQIEQLGGKDGAVVKRIFEAARRLNGDDRTAEDLEKNPGGITADSSGSD